MLKLVGLAESPGTEGIGRVTEQLVDVAVPETIVAVREG